MRTETILFVVLPALLVFGILFGLAARLYGNVEVCNAYYKEMSLIGCMFSSKTVITPSGSK